VHYFIFYITFFEFFEVFLKQLADILEIVMDLNSSCSKVTVKIFISNFYPCKNHKNLREKITNCAKN
jgi:hypothetical protein